jgi:hypothetical protein
MINVCFTGENNNVICIFEVFKTDSAGALEIKIIFTPEHS